MEIISNVIKLTSTISLCFFSMLIYPQSIGDTIYSGNDNIKVNLNRSPTANRTYVYCDSNQDGIMHANLPLIKNNILNENALEIVEETGVYICTSGNNIYLVENLIGSPVINLVCNSPGITGWSTIDIATNLNNELFVSEANYIRKINNNTCQTTSVIDFGFSNTSFITSLSFDKNNNMYFGGFNSSVYRSTGDLSTYELWHNFASGSAAGDFVIYADKMYIAWRKSGGNNLFEVTLDANNNYISHIDLGPLPYPTYGLASEFGKLYGVHQSYLYEIDLLSFDFYTVLTNNTGDAWYGSAGKNEGVSFSVMAFETLLNAQNNSEPLPDNWHNTIPGGQTIYVSIVNNNTNQSQIIPVTIIVNLPPNYVSPVAINHCQNDLNANVFDIRSTENLIVGSQANITVSYYETMHESIHETNPLPDIYTLNATTSKTIYVRLENSLTGCTSFFDFKIIINPIPVFNQPSDLIYCSPIGQSLYYEIDLFQQTESILQNLNSSYSVDFYQSNQDAIDQINPISTPYSSTFDSEEIFFIVTNLETGCFSMGSFMVHGFEENYNFTEFITMETSDWTNNQNSIVIKVTDNSKYEYSLDGFNYQQENFFNNLVSGTYSVYVKKLEDCSIFIKEVYLLFYPYYFTPNNDGINDFWKIQFSETEPNIKVYIYDRYGKFLKSLASNDKGWDGTYQNNQLPSSDYWFLVIRESGLEYRGHFTLKR